MPLPPDRELPARLPTVVSDKTVAKIGFAEVGKVYKRHAVGIASVHLCWSPRYPAQAAGPEEEPVYRIYRPTELLPLVARLERQLESRPPAGAGPTMPF